MMRKYECTEGFSIDRCDVDGFTIEESGMIIAKGSIWIESEEDYRVVGGDVRLDNEDETMWIEVSREYITERFKETL